jgi:hypothetical protein
MILNRYIGFTNYNSFLFCKLSNACLKASLSNAKLYTIFLTCLFLIESKESSDSQSISVVDKAKFYVDPKDFDDKILEYYKNDVISNDLAEMISKIAHKLSYAPNFINYSYREEMVGDGIIRMFKALMSKKYNHDKGTNPFSYFTRIAFNAFRNRIKKEKHMHETHEKYKNEFLMFSEGYTNLVKNNKNKKIE